MKKIKVTAVSYLNTKPLLYGLVQEGMDELIDLDLAIPSVCADKLLSGEADLGLVPVAIIPQLKEAHIVSDFCIGAVGEVKTVAIYSDCPMEEITHLYLDYHSRTSVNLAQVLLREFWKKDPELLKAEDGFIDKIGGTHAAVVIGDRTIGLDEKHDYVYDLGQAWWDHTGLPFVFAAWVSTKPLNPEFIERFNKALAKGIENIPKLIYLLQAPHPSFDLERYFSKYISYHLDAPKKQALELFLKRIAANAMASVRL